jgi:hypothetical protein
MRLRPEDKGAIGPITPGAIAPIMWRDPADHPQPQIGHISMHGGMDRPLQ